MVTGNAERLHGGAWRRQKCGALRQPTDASVQLINIDVLKNRIHHELRPGAHFFGHLPSLLSGETHFGVARVIVSSHDVIGSSEHGKRACVVVVLLVGAGHGDQVFIVLRGIGIPAHVF